MNDQIQINEKTKKSRELMRYAIDAGKMCKPEDEEHKPKVGASIELNGELIGFAFRGELEKGNHAEFTLLEKKLKGKDLSGATLYTTLEPCTERKTKTPCAEWIIKRGIKRVYIGMLDPNPLILGKGYEMLKKNGIEVLKFPPEFEKEIESDNSHFIKYCSLLRDKKLQNLEDLPYHISPHYRRLDDWYFILNRIYFDKNFNKDAQIIFAHLVEVLGSLSILHTNKLKELNPKEQIAKALAWWLALCGKIGVRSVEDMLFLKFPTVCPYCTEAPHNHDKCIKTKALNNSPDWVALYKLCEENNNKRPVTLAIWQQMFYKIYPIDQNDDYDKVLGRFTEEIGELAEALRVFKISPSYFLSEAADVFAWLMHLSNLYETKNSPLIAFEERGLYLEDTLFNLYPDQCKDCNQLICSCPPVLQTTIGRITNDGPDLSLFEDKFNFFMTKSDLASQFDFGSKEITIGAKEFSVTSKFIKQIYQLSKIFQKEIRHIKEIDNNLIDKIITALQNIISFATTQRSTQKSVDRLLKYLFELTENQIIELKPIFEKIDDSELKTTIWTAISPKDYHL